MLTPDGYVAEGSGENLFLVVDGKLVTPASYDGILMGITRDSVLHIARDWGMKVSERRISLEEVLSAGEKGTLKEVLHRGRRGHFTRRKLAYRGKTHVINGGKVGPLAQKLYDTIMGIQYGKIKDPYGWVERVI
jgi:branched-chain amino acid aminotransferase